MNVATGKLRAPEGLDLGAAAVDQSNETSSGGGVRPRGGLEETSLASKTKKGE